MRVSVSTHAQRRIDGSTRKGGAKHSAVGGGRDCSEMRPFKLNGSQEARLSFGDSPRWQSA